MTRYKDNKFLLYSYLIENTLRVDVQKYKALLSWYYSHHHIYVQNSNHAQCRKPYVIYYTHAYVCSMVSTVCVFKLYR